MKKLLNYMPYICMAMILVLPICVQIDIADFQYTIRYELNGGVNSEYNRVYLERGRDFVFEPASRAGYTFEGWYDSNDFETEITGVNNIKESITLYAKWERDDNAYGDLPVVDIITQNGQKPYDKETYINCSFEISNADDYNLKVSMKENYGDENSVGVRLRGNTTMGYPKKPYRIKFDSKTSVLGMPKNKSWVLLADYLDPSAIRNYTAFSIADKFSELDFTPSPNHVVLYFNGEYQGLYLLTEQVDEKSSRVDVEADIDPTILDFPFLVEMGVNNLSEGIVGVDTFTPNYFQDIEIKYPEYKDRNIPSGETDVVFDYIKEYINAAFTLLHGADQVEVSFSDTPLTLEQMVDVDSLEQYYLVNEIMRNGDSCRKSIYMHRSEGGLLEFGPVWDFDGAAGIWSGSPHLESVSGYVEDLTVLKNNTPIKHYIKNYNNYISLCDTWAEVKENVIKVIDDLRDYRSVIYTAACYDANYWYEDYGYYQFEMQYNEVRLYIYDRINFLDSILDGEHHSLFE